MRAWRSGVAPCPDLYMPGYDGIALKATSLDFPNHPTRGNGGAVGGRGLYHHSSSSYLWQGCAAELLRTRVGISLSLSDYKL